MTVATSRSTEPQERHPEERPGAEQPDAVVGAPGQDDQPDPRDLPRIEHPARRLAAYVFHYYPWRLIVSAISIVIASVASTVAAIFMQRVVDEVITPGLSTGLDAVMPTLVRIITAMGVVYGLGVITNFLFSRIMAVVTQGSLKHMRDDMFDRMQSLPIKYFDTHAHGSIMSTYTNDTDAVRQLIGQSVPTLIQSALTLGAMLAMMLYYSLWLTILVAVAAAVMVGATRNLGGKSSRYMVAQQHSLATEEGFIEEMMGGQKVVQVFNHEEAAKADFDALNRQLFSDSEKANQYGNILAPAMGNLGNLLYVLIAIVGGLLIQLQVTNIGFSGMGTITVGIIVSYLAMVRQLSQTINQASQQVALIAMGLAGAGRVFALIDEQPEQDAGYVGLVDAVETADGGVQPADHKTDVWAWRHPHQADGTVTYTRLRGEIVMKHVDFSYDGVKEVLHDVSLWAKPGQKIAFVGATGAGKTTITNLINRFYDIDDGKIRYDGININKITKADLRRSLGVVLQDVRLFTGTVMDNIRYGRLDATDEECIEAAKLANADGFIRRLPHGYQTVISGDSSSLSQGQAQLLSIARAAVADPPVMILDEATSSIDTRTEALVQAGMDNLMRGRTVFVIAHRLSTVRNSDAIMVLDHGRIIERGSHDQLIEQRGTYYQLYTGAFELE
ncbi:ATP-binding cassette, subfamily B [Actinomyces ruminicola]|uniref:Fatty acid ABC transporter ATP-binding/permease protein n=1 Tax=Actinomyces ruminicola TaxID=332524 RepID=A0A1G9V4X3_9ACTO|nr:ATP-binding cassette, subfamily B [Actinomyces ruminicola]